MRRPLVAAAALSLLLLAACAGDDDSGQADTDDIPTTLDVTSSSTTTTAPSNEQTTAPSIPGPVDDRGEGDATNGAIEIRTENFAFDPTYVRAVEGARITVSLRNDSSAPHTFTIAEQDVDQEVAPQSTAEVVVTLPPGTREPIVFVCRFHEAQGMKGAFYVQ